MKKTVEQINAEVDYLGTCLTDIHTRAGDAPLDEAASAAFEAGAELRAELVAERDALVADMEARNAEVSRIAETRGGTVPGAFQAPNMIVRNDPFDMGNLSISSSDDEYRSQALGAIEAVGGVNDAEREQAERVVRSQDRSVSLRVALTASPEYREAFAVAATRGLAACRDEHVRLLERAASLTDNAGGYAVPFTFDPTLIQTGSQSTNSFRAVSRVVQTTTDSWNGVSSGGVTFSWDAEGAEVSDDAPTLAQPSIPVYKGSGFVPFSMEIGGDWAAIESDLRTEFMTGKDRLEGAAFATGTGSAQPTGITKALDGTSSEIAPATGEAFAVADVYATEAALASQYTANATWHANRGTYSAVRQFDTGGGNALWERIGAGLPAELIGYPVYESSDMKSSALINPAASADNFIMVLGDFSNYVIVDRVGVSVELVPHLFHTSNNRPSGQRGLYCWFRTGADSVNDAAFAMLSIPTAA